MSNSPEEPEETDEDDAGGFRIPGYVYGCMVIALIRFLTADSDDEPAPISETAAPADVRSGGFQESRTPIGRLSGGAGQAAPAQSRSSLNVTGRDGTAELQQLAANMSEQEALALGLNVLFTGTDIYAARVKIANTGNVPIRVYPENLRVHFGGETAGVSTVSHEKFLQRGTLKPGYYFEGLVLYRARVDIGAAMRLAGGGLSYDDPTLQQVTYGE